MRTITDNFVFYKSWLDIIKSNYPDDINTQSEIIRNIVLYGIDGERNEGTEKMFLQQVFIQIDAAKSKHDKRVLAGRNGGKASKGGGAPKGNQNAKNYGAPSGNQNARKQTTSKQQANASKQQANNNINNNINNNNNIGIDIDTPAVCAPLKAAQPSVRWEVEQDENGNTRFVKHEYGGGTL